MKKANVSIEQIIIGTSEHVNTIDLAKVVNEKTMQIAGHKASLVRKGLIPKGLKPMLISEATKGMGKQEIGFVIKDIITLCPILTNEQIAKLFSVSVSTIGSYVAHMTMGHDVKVKTIEVVSRKANKVVTKEDTKVFDGRNKNIMRVKTVSHINPKQGKHDVMLSLCSDSLEIERLIHSKGLTKHSYDFCEFNEAVFSKLLRNLGESPYKVSNLSLNTLWSRIKIAKENQYSNIIADYCGAFTTFHKELAHVMKKRIVGVNGIIAATFSRRAKFPKALKKFNVYLPDGKVDNVASMSNFFSSFNGFELVETVTYHDTTAMILFIIKRVK